MSELRRLQLLVELGQRGTIAAVATATSFSTSAISQQLAQLERDIGTPLLEPDGRRVKLTPAGRALVAQAPPLLNGWERARTAALQGASELNGRLDIAVFQTAYLALIPGVVQELRARHPNLTLRVNQAEPEVAVPAVRARSLDAAVVEEFPGSKLPLSVDLVEHVLRIDRMHLALPLQRAGTGTTLGDCADMPWALEARGSLERSWAESMCREAGFEPLVAFETSDVIVQLELVRRGLAAAFIPALTPVTYLADVEIIGLPRTVARTISLVTRSSNESDPAIIALREAFGVNNESARRRR